MLVIALNISNSIAALYIDQRTFIALKFIGAAAKICRRGALVCVTHVSTLWDNDSRGCVSAATELEERGLWRSVLVRVLILFFK